MNVISCKEITIGSQQVELLSFAALGWLWKDKDKQIHYKSLSAAGTTLAGEDWTWAAVLHHPPGPWCWAAVQGVFQSVYLIQELLGTLPVLIEALIILHFVEF